MRRLAFLTGLLPLAALAACGGSSGAPSDLPMPPVFTGAWMSADSSLGFFHKLDNGDYAGSIRLTGYAVVEKRVAAFCQQDCAAVDYVFLRITDGLTPPFEDYLAEQKGNAFVMDGGIGLGCRIDDALAIHDEEGHVRAPVSPAISAMALRSTPDEQVTLTLVRNWTTAGADASDCYAHLEVVSAEPAKK